MKSYTKSFRYVKHVVATFNLHQHLYIPTYLYFMFCITIDHIIDYIIEEYNRMYTLECTLASSYYHLAPHPTTAHLKPLSTLGIIQ